MGNDKVGKSMSDNIKDIEERTKEDGKTIIGEKHEYSAYYPHYTIKDGQINKTSTKWWRTWLTYDWLYYKLETNTNMRVSILIVISLIVILILGAIVTAGILLGVWAFFGALSLFGGIVVVIRKKAALEDIENVSSERKQLTVHGRPAIWIGVVMLILGIVLILVEILT